MSARLATRWLLAPALLAALGLAPAAAQQPSDLLSRPKAVQASSLAAERHLARVLFLGLRSAAFLPSEDELETVAGFVQDLVEMMLPDDEAKPPSTTLATPPRLVRVAGPVGETVMIPFERLPLPAVVVERGSEESEPRPKTTPSLLGDLLYYTEPVSAPAEKIAPPKVQETRTGSLMFGIGISSDAGLTGSVVINDRELILAMPKEVREAPAKEEVNLKVSLVQMKRGAAESLGLKGRVNGNPAFVLDNDQINQKVRALERAQKAWPISHQVLTMPEGGTVAAFSGGQLMIPFTSAAGLEGVSFMPYGLSVRFTPVITCKDRIRLQINAQLSTRDMSLSNSPTHGCQSRTIETKVEMRDGQTYACGGLETDKNDSVIVLIVTPQIVKRSFSSGTPAPRLPGAEGRSPFDNRRMIELLNNSEELRQIEREWERIWGDDRP